MSRAGIAASGPHTPVVVVALTAAVGAAACFAIASVLQQRAARRAPIEDALRPALLINLAHRRLWLGGLVASAVGFGLQGVALDLGCLALVQPVILLQLLFALPFIHSGGRRIAPSQATAAFVVAVGVAAFLIAARPHGGRPSVPPTTWAKLGLTVAVLIGFCSVVARRSGRLPSAALLAGAAGVTFGTLAALLDSVAFMVAHDGIARTLSVWQPYALAAVAPTGEIFAQSAFQAGPLTASMPVINTLEPATAIAIGALVFGGHLRHTPLALGIEVLAAVAVVGAVAVLGRTTPALVRR